MPLPWLRLYSDLLTSRKFHRLSDTLKARLILLWCLAAKHDGILPGVDDVAFSLRLAPEDAQQTIDDLKAARFLDESDRGLTPHDWNEHQYVSDVSTGRVRRFREKRETGAKRSVKQKGGVSGNGIGTTVKLPDGVQEHSRADSDLEQTTSSAAEIASACDLAAETFDLSDEERATAWAEANDKPKTSLLVPEVETVLKQVAGRIHARHPALRRCAIGEVKKQLRAIARRFAPAARIDLLRRVDQNHAAWCAWPGWLKDDGQYAKGLDNWLAPTKERWSEPPRFPAGGTDGEPPKLMM